MSDNYKELVERIGQLQREGRTFSQALRAEWDQVDAIVGRGKQVGLNKFSDDLKVPKATVNNTLVRIRKQKAVTQQSGSNATQRDPVPASAPASPVQRPKQPVAPLDEPGGEGNKKDRVEDRKHTEAVPGEPGLFDPENPYWLEGYREDYTEIHGIKLKRSVLGNAKIEEETETSIYLVAFDWDAQNEVTTRKIYYEIRKSDGKVNKQISPFENKH